MLFSLPQWGQFITLLMIALALGMDAFSLSIGMGMKQLPFRKIAWLSLSIGLFHVLMPLIGIALGQFLGKVMKEIATMVGGGMLCFLGINMIYHLLKHKDEVKGFDVDSIFSILIFSLSVSVDSLSAGLSLGLFAVDRWLAILLFGLSGTLLAGAGLYLGRFVGSWLGRYGEALGGTILILLGSKFLW